MKSMTGYGQGRAETGESHIEVSLRSVNGRFLETRFHLPKEFIPVENELKREVQKYFQRGTVDVFVSRRVKWEALEAEIVVQKKLIGQYKKAFESVAKLAGLKAKPTLESYLRLNDLIKLEVHDEVTTEESKALLKALKQACTAAQKEREREGESLKKDLESSLTTLTDLVSQVAKLRETINQGLQAKTEARIKARMASLQGGGDGSETLIDSARLTQEVVFLLEKADVNEELVRLDEHLTNYRGLLEIEGSLGKKLDFYTQEILREVNTIGSKSNVSQLTQTVVEAKTIVERLREQVQNVE